MKGAYVVPDIDHAEADEGLRYFEYEQIGRMVSAIAYPIHREGVLLGAVAVESRRSYAFGHAEYCLLHMVAGYLAGHWRLFQQIAESAVNQYSLVDCRRRTATTQGAGDRPSMSSPAGQLKRPVPEGLPRDGSEWYALIVAENPEIEILHQGEDIWIDPATGDFEIGDDLDASEVLARRTGQESTWRFWSRRIGSLQRVPLRS
jgi:hypothetical protein